MKTTIISALLFPVVLLFSPAVPSPRLNSDRIVTADQGLLPLRAEEARLPVYLTSAGFSRVSPLG
jgi:hypothetical protein